MEVVTRFCGKFGSVDKLVFVVIVFWELYSMVGHDVFENKKFFTIMNLKVIMVYWVILLKSKMVQLMSLIINIFYSIKYISIRELFSNASEALDEIRYRSLTEPSVLDGQKEMVIKIIPDKDSNTLTLIETGIGMPNARMNSRWRPKMDASIVRSRTKAFQIDRAGTPVASPICRWAPDQRRDQTPEQ